MTSYCLPNMIKRIMCCRKAHNFLTTCTNSHRLLQHLWPIFFLYIFWIHPYAACWGRRRSPSMNQTGCPQDLFNLNFNAQGLSATFNLISYQPYSTPITPRHMPSPCTLRAWGSVETWLWTALMLNGSVIDWPLRCNVPLLCALACMECVPWHGQYNRIRWNMPTRFRWSDVFASFLCAHPARGTRGFFPDSLKRDRRFGLDQSETDTYRFLPKQTTTSSAQKQRNKTQSLSSIKDLNL